MQGVGVEEDEGRARGQRRQPLDLVAIGIGRAEMAALEGQELGSLRGKEVANLAILQPRVGRPERSGLRLEKHQPAGEIGVCRPKRGCEEDRLVAQPPILNHRTDDRCARRILP